MVLALSIAAGCGLTDPAETPAPSVSVSVSSETSAEVSASLSATEKQETGVSTEAPSGKTEEDPPGTANEDPSGKAEEKPADNTGDDWVVPENDGEEILFTTTDRDGNAFSELIFTEHRLTMVNMWEPWCGPCVGEMPDLEKLYEDYYDKGLMILGVYSDTSMEGDVDYILDMTGVKYPILLMPEEFVKWQTDYVPTTFFVDGNGRIIDFGVNEGYGDGPQLIGSRPYESWEEFVKGYLDR